MLGPPAWRAGTPAWDGSGSDPAVRLLATDERSARPQRTTSTRTDLDELNGLCPPNPYPSAATDWIRTRHIGLVAQDRWDRVSDVREWIDSSRLNVAYGLRDHLDDPGVAPAIGAYLEHRDRAIANLEALRAQLGAPFADG